MTIDKSFVGRFINPRGASPGAHAVHVSQPRLSRGVRRRHCGRRAARHDGARGDCVGRERQGTCDQQTLTKMATITSITAQFSTTHKFLAEYQT